MWGAQDYGLPSKCSEGGGGGGDQISIEGFFRKIKVMQRKDLLDAGSHS